MEYYCGIDIIEVDRVKKALEETYGFKEKVFTKKEIEIGNSKKGKSIYEYYAGRFAAKEAIYKAISNIKNDFEFWNVEILNDLDNKNRPYVNLLEEELKELQQNGKINVDVSISHIEKIATATAVVKVDKS